MGYLFSIETNQGFSSSPEPLDGQLGQIAGLFQLPPIQEAQRIDKLNQFSQIYLLQSSSSRFVLRSAPEQLSPNLELQCRIMAELEGARVIRPRPTPRGAYVANSPGENWICYPYIDGALFADARHGPADATIAALNILTSLRRWDQAHPGLAAPLYHLKRAPSAWGCLSARLQSPESLAALSQKGRTFLKQNLRALEPLQALATEAEPGPAELAHCDLQHANVIVGADGPVIIDLEDINLDSIKVCAAHAIFRMSRHAILAGLTDLHEARHTLIPNGIRYGVDAGLLDGDRPQDIAKLALLRSLGDIHAILEMMKNPETAWACYDLEKKLQNVFEIPVLFLNHEEIGFAD